MLRLGTASVGMGVHPVHKRLGYPQGGSPLAYTQGYGQGLGRVVHRAYRGETAVETQPAAAPPCKKGRARGAQSAKRGEKQRGGESE